MPITFNSSGGFLAGTISSSGNDIFITTSGSIGSINVGNVEYTGSQVIEKDAAGNVRNKKTFNTDGSITQEKFDASGVKATTKIRNPLTGVEVRRSASATDNQIEFQQNSNGAFITVSGSSPGYNIIETSGDNDFRLIRATSDQLIRDLTNVFSVGINSSGQYEISRNLGFGQPGLKVSSSGEVIVDGTLTATSLNVTHFTSSFITASTIETSGSTIFGDDITDTHLFRGHITASGNISASGTIQSTGNITTDGELSVNTIVVGSTITHVGDSNTKITFDDDDINLTAAGKTAIDITYDGDGGGDTREITFNEGHADIDVRIEGDTDANLFFTNAGTERVGIGTNSPTEKLTVIGSASIAGHITASGNISASGDVFAHSGSFNYITASIIDVDGDTIRFGGEEFTKQNIRTLKLGRSLKPLREGRTAPDLIADDLFLSGSITASGDVFNSKLVQMTNSSSVIDTFNTASFRSVKYVLQVTSASNYQVSEMLVLHHNSTASNTEYAQINSGLNLINFSTDVNNSNVRLNANGSFISCSVRYERTIIPI